MLKLIHVSPHVFTLGGMQAVLRHHLAHDSHQGIDSRQAVLFERPNAETAGVNFLGWNWRCSIRGMRRAYGALMAQWPGRLCLYHNLWGVPFLAEADHASRRFGYLHSFTPRLELELAAQRGLLDGLIAVSPAQRELALRCLPELGADRIRLLPLPIEPPNPGCHQLPLAGRPIVLGYSGRLVKAIKRIDRLPELTQRLKHLGVAFRLEILGDGPDSGWLKSQLNDCPEVKFHGAQMGDSYWNILSGWDLMLYVSDSEGTPVSMLEGLSVGVLPLFPRLSSGGTAYTQQVDPALLYESGEVAQAAQIVCEMITKTPSLWEEWRERGLQAVRGHLGDSYLKAFAGYLAEMQNLPRLSISEGGARPNYWGDRVPLGLLSRWWPNALLRH